MSDTETLLALLASLVPGSVSQEALLETLIDSDGDVEVAAKAINTSRKLDNSGSGRTRKRKRTGDLDGWLRASTTQIKGIGRVMDISQSPANIELSESSPSSSHPPKKVISLMTVLKQPPETGPALPRLAPMTLSTASLVEKHTSCTLHSSVLPSDLACRLFYAMLREAVTWSKNKWWLFDRLVESPHKTSFYVRKRDAGEHNWHEAAQFWYNGRPTPPPSEFLPEMEDVCAIVERIVNEKMRGRHRYPLEWGGNGPERLWRANVAAANCYTGSSEGVGPHSDQLTYLGPYPTIASLSLGATRTFRLREVIPKEDTKTRTAQTFNIPLRHNTLLIMHAGTQECYKHSIPSQPTIDLFHPPFPPPSDEDNMMSPSTSRINLTFRFYRPDYRPSTIPRCACSIPMVLRADMKGRPGTSTTSTTDCLTGVKYWWVCYAGAQNEGKGCDSWRTMDVKKEGRGPFIADTMNDIT